MACTHIISYTYFLITQVLSTRPFSTSTFISFDLGHDFNRYSNLLTISNELDLLTIVTKSSIQSYCLSQLRSLLSNSESHQLLKPPKPINELELNANKVNLLNTFNNLIIYSIYSPKFQLQLINSQNFKIENSFDFDDEIISVIPNPNSQIDIIAVIDKTNRLYFVNKDSMKKICDDGLRING